MPGTNLPATKRHGRRRCLVGVGLGRYPDAVSEVQIAVGGEMIVLALIGFPATKRGGTDAANRQAVPVAPAADLEGAVDRGEDVIVDAFRDTADR